MRLSYFLPGMLVALATPSSSHQRENGSPYILAFAGDRDEKHSDFFAVIDVRPRSSTKGKVVATLPIGMTASMPHHLEYVLPRKGKLLFANAHHHEMTLLIDTADALRPKLAKSMAPPPPLRFGHDFARLANGNVLAGFLRSEGSSPASGDTLLPGNHGGLAEYTEDGKLLRIASAAVPGFKEPIHPYGDLPMLTSIGLSRPRTDDGRFQRGRGSVWRYSTLKLLHTRSRCRRGSAPTGRSARSSAIRSARAYCRRLNPHELLWVWFLD